MATPSGSFVDFARRRQALQQLAGGIPALLHDTFGHYRVTLWVDSRAATATIGAEEGSGAAESPIRVPLASVTLVGLDEADGAPPQVRIETAAETFILEPCAPGGLAAEDVATVLSALAARSEAPEAPPPALASASPSSSPGRRVKKQQTQPPQRPSTAPGSREEEPGAASGAPPAPAVGQRALEGRVAALERLVEQQGRLLATLAARAVQAGQPAKSPQSSRPSTCAHAAHVDPLAGPPADAGAFPMQLLHRPPTAGGILRPAATLLAADDNEILQAPAAPADEDDTTSSSDNEGTAPEEVPADGGGPTTVTIVTGGAHAGGSRQERLLFARPASPASAARPVSAKAAPAGAQPPRPISSEGVERPAVASAPATGGRNRRQQPRARSSAVGDLGEDIAALIRQIHREETAARAGEPSPSGRPTSPQTPSPNRRRQGAAADARHQAATTTARLRDADAALRAMMVEMYMDINGEDSDERSDDSS